MNYINTLALAFLAAAPFVNAETISLSALSGIENITCFDDAGKTKPRANQNTLGGSLVIEGTTYTDGIGTHAPSVMIVKLNGATSFSGIIGVDDGAETAANHGVVDYVITGYADSKDAATQLATGHLERANEVHHADLSLPNLSGYQYVKIDIQKGAQAWADHVDVVNASFEYTGEAPSFVTEASMYQTGDNTVNLPTEPTVEGAQILPLSSLQIENITNGWGTVRANKSIDNNAITMKGKTYTSGLGIHANAKMVVKLNGSSPKFHCEIGIDDEVAGNCKGNQKSNVKYQVILRDQAGREDIKYEGTINYNDASTVIVDLENLTEYRYLILDFDAANGNESDHVDLGNAYFEFLYQNSNEPEIVPESYITSGLNCATTVFSQPGVKFMQKIQSVLDNVQIKVENLPAGLTFNEERCLIEGIVAEEGVYEYTITCINGDEELPTPVTLTVSSNLLMPTPFLCWMSWNVVQGDVSYDVIKKVADNMEKYGMVDAGYNMIMIDDLWHASSRAADGTPRANETRFPGGTLKPTADYVHSKGMRIGNYTNAASTTCAGAFASLDYEEIDAKTYADWGIEMVKVDYCHAPADLATCRARYEKFGKELAKYNIIQFVCEWGTREPWKWAAEIGSPVWRSTLDERDCWIARDPGVGVTQSIQAFKDLWMYNGVNRWNDADMVCIGIHGTGRSSSDLCASGKGMTMDEYRTQMALWSMWQSPIAVTADLRKDLGTGATDLTQEDIDLLCNPDLLALNQDRMGQSGMPIFHDNDLFVMAKDCENGDVALSVTNLSASPKSYTFNLAEVPGLDGTTTYTVRDCVNKQNLDDAQGSIEAANIPSHATVVYRLSDKSQTGINAAAAAEALGDMTVSVDGTAIHVCLPGTEGASKRLLLCDVEGRVVAEATGADECFEFSAAGLKGVYFVHTTCAARSLAAKLAL
ncbi:MAG: NPCBM/NEW2 domain-containing protein [Bacteroides sp.]|nr:NPCBM/NEW2 domain-containing protein [Bacteroides sp.]MCM1378947.1 NPCBM/NEW2 domain-containing protein [Bacteroides sp.]MCM1445563.1 NPCBM/NEW2 domain-containing protein [Prevotella sp.]